MRVKEAGWGGRGHKPARTAAASKTTTTTVAATTAAAAAAMPAAATATAAATAKRDARGVVRLCNAPGPVGVVYLLRVRV